MGVASFFLATKVNINFKLFLFLNPILFSQYEFSSSNLHIRYERFLGKKSIYLVIKLSYQTLSLVSGGLQIFLEIPMANEYN